jgi:hypothetical protein
VTTSADVVAKTFFDGWVACGYGIPQVLLTDNGSQFVAKFFQAFCKVLGVKQVCTSAYRPSTNGQTERFNRTVAEFMTAYVSEHQQDWEELAAIATYSYNSKPHSSTGFTPFELVTFTPKSSLLSQLIVEPQRQHATKPQLRNAFLATVAESCSLAKENLTAQQLRYKTAYDAHVREAANEIGEGDLAYVKTYVAPREQSKKLILPAVGPFVVTKVGKDRRTFRVRTAAGDITVAADRVRKCPSPKDLPESMELAKQPGDQGQHDKNAEESIDDLDEYVVDHIVAHRRDRDGFMRVKVRWFGYGSAGDTWEPLLHLPPEMLRRYVKRKRLRPQDFFPATVPDAGGSPDRAYHH